MLTLAEFRDRADGDGLGRDGGFRAWTVDGQVVADWMPVSELFDEAQQGYRHPTHPLAVFEEELRAVMERTIAGVLYAAGFTVTLQPPLRDIGPHEDSGAKGIVTAAPRIRVWTIG